MNKKEKLKNLLTSLEKLQKRAGDASTASADIATISDSLIQSEITNLTARIKDNTIVKTLSKFGTELANFKKDFDLKPIVQLIQDLEKDIQESEQKVLSDFKEFKTKILKEFEKNVEQLYTNGTLLEEDIDSFKEKFNKKLDTSLKAIPNFSSEIQDIKSQIQELALGQEFINVRIEDKSKETVIVSNNDDIQNEIKDLRTEINRRFSNLGGGQANRQININSSVMSTKYTDINFKNAGNIGWSASDDDVFKRVNIVASILATSGGGSGSPGGADTQVQFNDGGSFGGAIGVIWDKNASIFSANNVEVASTRAISSVLTINGFYPAYSGADATVAHANANYSSVATALINTSVIGGTTYLSDGTYTEGQILIKRSATRLNLSQGATITADGSVVSPLIKPSVTGLSRIVIEGGKLLQSNATAQGVGLDLSDVANTWVSKMRIEEFGTGIKMYDTANTTFYNSARDIQMFNVNTGIDLGGSQANMNLWDNVRIRPKTGSAGTGINMSSVRGNTFLVTDVEAGAGGKASITGIHMDGATRDNLFAGIWVENNENGVIVDAGATNNIFIGGTITDNTNDIIDNGTGTAFWGTNKTGKKLFRIPNITDINGVPIETFTDGSGVVEFGQQGSVFGGIKLDGLTTGNVTIQPASVAGNWSLTLPGNDGNAGQYLLTDGNGITQWASVTAVGGSGITRSVSVLSVSSTLAAAASTDYVFFPNVGVQLTLPTAVGNSNSYTIKNMAASSILVVATTGEDIDGSTTALMPTQYESLNFISNNSIWAVV